MKKIFRCNVWSAMLTLLVTVLALNAWAQQPKYVFYFIGDGMGINQVTATQMYKAGLRGVIGADSLSFTNFPVRNFVTTYSASHPVTCSSAAGTAMACGQKTKNASVGVDPNGARLTSIAEKAKSAGYKVGITTTVSVNHATPSAFYAHQKSRSMDYEIGLDALRANFDLYAGAGLRQRKPKKNPGAPKLIDVFADSSYVIAHGKAEFDKKNIGAKKILYLREQTGSDEVSLVPALDRRGGELTLPQITQGSIDFLSRDNDKGFFLMVEGGTIDWVLHSQDAASAFAEIEEFSDAVKVAYEFYLKNPDNTLIVVTADHETGGITIGGEHSQLSLEIFRNQKSSQMQITARLNELRNKAKHVEWKSVRKVLEEECGFWTNVPITPEDEKALMDCYKESFATKEAELTESLYLSVEPISVCAIGILTKMAHMAWATNEHTAGVVPVYAIGVGAEQFDAANDNTDLPKIISKIAGY